MPRISLSWALILGLLTAIGPLCTDFYLPALPDITRQLNATGVFQKHIPTIFTYHTKFDIDIDKFVRNRPLRKVSSGLA